LVTDVNRYYAPGVALADEVGQLRVTAAFKASEIPAFMSALANVVPVEVAEAADGSFRVEPAGD
jgi:transmembrane sensor